MNYLHCIIVRNLWPVIFVLLFATTENTYGAKMNPTKAELRMVNLETTVVIRSIKHLSWQESQLPPVQEGVKILVVGHDHCLLKERLQYLIAENNSKISGRKIEVVPCHNIEEANHHTLDKQVVFVIFLRSVQEKWGEQEFKGRSGLVLYGQGRSYMRKGLSLCSRVENNRLKISLNLKKMNSAEIEVDKKLLLSNRILSVHN
jgi:hypothetical protein